MSADEGRIAGVEVMTMMSDMVVCQTCRRNPGMYQCDYCGQIALSVRLTIQNEWPAGLPARPQNQDRLRGCVMHLR